MRYTLHRSDGELVAASRNPILVDADNDAFTAGDKVWFDPRPSEGGYTDSDLLDAPALVPQVVTRRQAKQALLLAGMLGNVQAAIDAIPDPLQRGLVQIEWDDSQVFERTRPALIAMGAALGLDTAAMDQLFITAATLP